MSVHDRPLVAEDIAVVEDFVVAEDIAEAEDFAVAVADAADRPIFTKTVCRTDTSDSKAA
jgi:hypothetical protein